MAVVGRSYYSVFYPAYTSVTTPASDFAARPIVARDVDCPTGTVPVPEAVQPKAVRAPAFRFVMQHWNLRIPWQATTAGTGTMLPGVRRA